MTGAAEQSTQGTAVKDYSTMTVAARGTHLSKQWPEIRELIPAGIDDYKLGKVREFEELLNSFNQTV